MIFKRLFRSKRLRDQETVTRSGEDPTKLAEQATNSDDPGTRRQACRSITDPGLLQRIAAEDGDPGVRDIAAARLRNLLAGVEPKEQSLELELRLTHLRDCGDPALAAHAARHGREAELRKTALKSVSDPQTLAECAVQDAVAAVRLAAAQRLEEKQALEQVARQIGKRDKNVYRQVKGKLKEIAEREQAPQRLRQEAEGLCARLERLGRSNNWVQDKALWDHLEKQWQELGDGIPAELVQRHDRAADTFQSEYQAYREANLAQIQEQEAREQLHRDKQELLQELQAPLELQTLAPEADIAATEGRLEDLKGRWEQLGPLPNGREQQLQQEFTAGLHSQQEKLQQRRRLHERTQRLARMQQRAEKWLERSLPLECKKVDQWLKDGKRLALLQPNDSAAGQFEHSAGELRARLEKQIAHAEQKLEQLPERLQLLEQELDEGVLKQATALHQSIHADLALIESSGIGRQRAKEAERHYRRITPRLRELQNWRKWGTDQHREELCVEMERLTGAELPLEELTELVQALQGQWKGLDRGGSRVNEKLWQRFHQAADQAYERCRPYLEQQAAERAANRQAREQLCSQLEEFLQQVDWERMDWKKAVHAEREMRGAWGRMGPVEPRRRRGLERRFHTAIKRLDGHLAEERARNRAFKKELIAKAEALVDEPDLERAIQEIKALQKQWHTTVASKRKQENNLWKQFRGACDQVFERREGVQQAQRAELEAHAQSLGELCEELEGLADHTGDDPQALLHQLHKLQGRWDSDQAQELTRQDSSRLNRRWQEGVKQVQLRIRELHRAAEQAQLERLQDLATLCRELEAAVESGAADTSSADAWRERWSALPQPDDESARKGVARRFDSALKALAGGAALESWRAALSTHLRERAELCLQLEVLAGIDSPEEAAEERLAFQVSRLSEHLAQGEADPLDQAPRLRQAWYLCGAVPANQAERLEARFQRAEQALMEGEAAP